MTNEELARSLLGRGFLDPAAFTAPPAPPTPDRLPGQPFGKYRVLRKLGEGGSGRVYLALDPLLHRRVALKVLKNATPEDVERFAREARLTAELSHPHVVRVHEVGCIGRKPYIAMDLVEGGPLRPSGPEQAVAALLPVARALEAAHRRGMIHRDVKPGNILVDAAGKAWLTDFGAARHVAAASVTCSGDFLGTPAFMSPEQARGEIRRLTPASDVFSLGSTLYYAALRRLPFDGQSPLEVVRKVAEASPLRPRRVDPAFPRGLENVLLKAMAPDPGDRYPTAGALADDLERLLRQPPRTSRRRAPAAAAALAVAALAAWLAWPAEIPAPRPPLGAVLPAPLRTPEPPRVAARVEAPPPAAEPRPQALDPELRERILRDVLEAPAGLRRPFLSDEEARRTLALLAEAAPDAEERRFLAERVGRDAAAGLAAERRFLAAEQARLDALAAGRPDVVVRRDGRAYVGRIMDVSASGVVLLHEGESRFFPTEDLRAAERGASREAEFARRRESGEDPAALARWCLAEGLLPQRESLLFRRLARDPGDVALRRALGFPPEGPLHAAARESPAPRRLPFDGDAFRPEELERTLRERGFVVVGGAWCKLRAWRWAPPEPWTGAPLAAAGRGVVPRIWEDVRTEKAYDVVRLKLVDVRRATPRFRYLGPAGSAGGRAVIDVQAPGPLVACAVRAVTEVVDGRGSARLFAVTPSGISRPLFAVGAGREDGRHEIGDAVRGLDRFSLVADLEGDVLFLPSTAAVPLEVEASVAVPHPELTRLLPPR